MHHYELVTEKRHEAKAQELRQERDAEKKRLDKLKMGLQMKIAAERTANRGPVRAA